MHDMVVTLNGKHWPAWQREDGLLVDLRLFRSGPGQELTYRPDALREDGVPDALIAAAGESNPQGFVLLKG